jgi:hypothetical protein
MACRGSVRKSWGFAASPCRTVGAQIPDGAPRQGRFPVRSVGTSTKEERRFWAERLHLNISRCLVRSCGNSCCDDNLWVIGLWRRLEAGGTFCLKARRFQFTVLADFLSFFFIFLFTNQTFLNFGCLRTCVPVFTGVSLVENAVHNIFWGRGCHERWPSRDR